MENEKAVNIIYYNGNYQNFAKNVIKDCQHIQNKTKKSLILTDNLDNFKLLLNYILKNNNNIKLLLIINGNSAEKVINFIKTNKYKSLFINGCIFTRNLQKYLKIKDKNPNFIVKITTLYKDVIQYIEEYTKTIIQDNEKINYNTLINYDSYKNEYFKLHEQLALNYGDKSEKSFSNYFKLIKEDLNNEKLSDIIKSELINCFQTFSLLETNDYEKAISTYIKYDSFSKYLNESLLKKDLIIYNHIGYFAGNLMYSIVNYGKEKGKGVDRACTFYRGMELNIVEVLEYLKNKNNLITFPYFLSMTTKKDFVELITKRNIKRKNSDLFSVVIKIEYLYDDGYEPVVFDLKDLAQYPDEEEYILLPFTFLILKNIKIDSKNFTVDIDLEIVGKLEILETYMKDGKTIQYNEKNHIMFVEK